MHSFSRLFLPRTHFLACSWVFSLAFSLGGELQAGTPFFYSYHGLDDQDTSIAYETAVGTREARPFGERGFEQGVRTTFSLGRFASLEAWGGMLLEPGEGVSPEPAFSFEATVHVLEQERNGLDVSLGAGYLQDFQADAIPRVRLTVGKAFGQTRLCVSSLAETPLSEERDEVDLFVGMGISHPVGHGLQVGLEVVGQDLEGLWEPEEAEGGAKVVVGPSVGLEKGEHLDVKVHAGAVTALASQGDSSQAGVVARASVRYTF